MLFLMALDYAKANIIKPFTSAFMDYLCKIPCLPSFILYGLFGFKEVIAKI
ncbi:hypothetical protein [Helicobacter sp. 13S00477-4]|uniref:hypothetical protein n=1 Tax=Helicobacter sp. 13S00477-4 TaxID=1905759 RepID=UPI0015DABDA4|nr:hypothetical protein [Helicobacter sp. 13S00477-4]